MKTQLFFENATLLFREWGIVPLMYGSLGLEYLTKETLHADDIDILIPEVFLRDKWCEFQEVLTHHGYLLTDEHEHTFQKDGIAYAYAPIEELESFAGIAVHEIPRHIQNNIPFLLLSLAQYQAVYTASAKDGYRANTRQKKDGEKLAVIERYLKRES